MRAHFENQMHNKICAKSEQMHAKTAKIQQHHTHDNNDKQRLITLLGIDTHEIIS